MLPALSMTISWLLLAALPLQTQAKGSPSNAPASAAPTPPAASAPAATAPSPLDRQELERRLEATLTGVQLRGTWQIASAGPTADGAVPRNGPVTLSDPLPDTYTILEAHKAEADWWLLRVRIQYEAVDAVVPIRLRVLFAGETPVLTVDDLSMPGGHTYSARVMIHGGFYAGTWSGPDCGGVLSGQLVNAPKEAREERD